MYDLAFCCNAVFQNLSSELDNCIRLLLAVSSRDEATTNVTCSSFMTSLMAEFVNGALRTSFNFTARQRA